MLVLKNSYIKPPLELENALTLRVQEEVPFSTENEENGFNPPTGTFVDGSAIAYPKVEDLVFLLFSFLKPYEPLDTEQIELPIRRVSNTSGERVLTEQTYTSSGFSYSDIAYIWDIELGDKQGVVEIYMVALPKDDANFQFYYSTTEDRIIQVTNGVGEFISNNYEFVNTITNKATNKCLFIPLLSKTFSIIEKKILFLRKDRCKDEKLIEELMRIENLIRIACNVAINQAEVKMYTKAQEAIELIEKIIAENERLWKY